MTHTHDELVRMLSDIEPSETTYAGLSAEDVPALRELLGHEETWLAARAVHALARFRDAEAVSAIEQAASDDRSAVRVAVATVSATLPPEDARRLLPGLLADPDVGVVKYAVRSARPAFGRPVREALDRVVRQGDLPDTVLDAARRRLEQMRRPR